MAGGSRQVFVSYARGDARRVDALVEGLRQLRYDVWLDQELTGGQAWWDAVLSQIRASSAVLVAVSPAALESVAVRREYEYGHAVGRPLLPVIVDGVPLETLPSLLAPLQVVDYRQPGVKNAFALAAALAALPAPQALPQPLPDPPPIPISYLSGLKEHSQAATLSLDEQLALIGRLKAALGRASEREAAEEVLRSLQNRNDLYQVSAQEIESLLSPHNHQVPAPRPHEVPSARQAGPRARQSPAAQAGPGYPPTEPGPSRLTRTLTGHTGPVGSVAFSLDGHLLATASRDGTARLWDPATGDCLRTLTGHTDWVNGVAFSLDGHLLATASRDRTARVWDPATGDCLHTLTGHTESVGGVAFSLDGHLLATAGGPDRTARLWDPATGDCLHTLSHVKRVWDVAFSPDGRLLATASGDKRTRLWDPATGKRLRTLTGHTGYVLGHTGYVLGVAFSPDGQLLATASADRTARVWDPATTACLRALTGHAGGVWGVAFSPDGQLLATASDDGTARLWALT
jgi:WD40 repeat protein